MDALDEFFAVWTEPEAWCEICGEFPAIHVVLRDTGGKFGGIMSHVRIWNPNTQTRVPACRHCCKDQMSAIGQSTSPPVPQAWPSPSVPPQSFFTFVVWWAARLGRRTVKRLNRGLRHLYRLR
ncbi:MAG: hypothetical protein ETSY1_06740 [Candidatus Entotheonella factor]|uniref:Uncharacterized protein n=2 Tax=Candidatus Entotheonella TaxID=93171 RepID=W4LU80_ENTF1|nr:MAG: hypothetical protein ETSY1_06740 [Candidatus Entotheonella factor]